MNEGGRGLNFWLKEEKKKVQPVRYTIEIEFHLEQGKEKFLNFFFMLAHRSVSGVE